MKVLLTGCAGFIGSHVLERLISDGHEVVGIDNFDPLYDRSIKEKNLSASRHHSNFTFIEEDLAEAELIADKLSRKNVGRIDAIIHLAARGGVRPSIEDPVGYQRANVQVTQNLLEYARRENITQFVFASSSSVYGKNPNVPWRESDCVLAPISPYASTKVSCELMGHVYSEIYGIRFLALRFFTVYGARQRPDLAIHQFIKKIRVGEPIQMFGDGSTRRDYTHISDIVEGVIKALHYRETPFEVVNLGNNQTVTLREMISGIERELGMRAVIEHKPEQPGDVPQTWASIEKAQKLFGYAPKVGFFERGIEN